MNELALQGVCQEDLITAWSNPSPAMQSAARLVQGKFRRAKLACCLHTRPSVEVPFLL